LVLITLFWAAVASAQAQNLDSRGLHVQPWISQSSSNLGTDLQNAAAQGKDLLILVEQRGCQYCAKLHAVNFARDEITDLIKNSFFVIQIDLVGDRMMTDFDGAQLSEADLARKWGVQFTPTTMVFSAANAGAASRAQAETFRLPGYLEPFYYYTALDYFASGAFETQPFKAFLDARINALAEQAIVPEFW
jgi:thioredoxin-related protein